MFWEMKISIQTPSPFLFPYVLLLQDGSECGVRIQTAFSLLTKKGLLDEWPKRERESTASGREKEGQGKNDCIASDSD